MTKIIDINERRKTQQKLSILSSDNEEKDKFLLAMYSAMHCAKASRTWSDHKVAWLLNCRDALDRAMFYLEDELNEELGIDRDDQD